jgi:hypothetical protein
VKKVLFSIMALAFLSGCASSKMMVLEPAKVDFEPPKGQSSIIFMRPAAPGFAVQASLFDVTSGDPEFIGIISNTTRINHVCKPGSYRFAVVSESAKFMDVIVEADRNYLARVSPRFGLFKARFALEAVVGSREETLDKECGSCNWVANTALSTQWAQENMADIKQKVTEYMPDFEKDTDKAVLKASDYIQ